MSSASFKVGVTNDDHISTKVLAPPGGRTSISFGGAEATPAAPAPKHVNPCQAARNKSSIFGSEPAPTAEVKPAHQHIVAQEKRGKSSVFAAPDPMKPVTDYKSDNVIVAEKPKAEPVHTSVHVLAPPGGKSQISFG